MIHVRVMAGAAVFILNSFFFISFQAANSKVAFFRLMVRTLHFLCRDADSISAGTIKKHSLMVEHGPFKLLV
jgi:hypothetical protein